MRDKAARHLAAEASHSDRPGVLGAATDAAVMNHRAIVKTLSDTHRMMERVLTLVRVQVAILQPGADEGGFRLLKNAIGYLHEYPGVFHHPAEEILFDRLVRYAPECRTLCKRLSEQHRDFGQREENLLQLVDSAQGGDLEACWRIEKICTAYCAEHAEHIRNEESETFPRAVECLKPGDWNEVGKEVLRAADPLDDRATFQRFENLYDYLVAVGEVN